MQAHSRSAAADLTARARLDHARSQAVFRTLLDALSHPGLQASLPGDAAPGVPRALVPALALADVGVAVGLVGPGGWDDLVRTATGACITALPDAELVAALRPPTPAEVASLAWGTAESPERGARLFVACRSLRPGPVGGRGVAVTGPGVAGTRRFGVDGVDDPVVTAIGQACAGYPAGIDTWFVSDGGQVVGLPRSVTLVLEED